eukprot:5639238-Pleurochrysis_carterae.AAC.1
MHCVCLRGQAAGERDWRQRRAQPVAPYAHTYASVAASHRLTVEGRRRRHARRSCRGSAPVVDMVDATSVPRLHSVVRCLCAAHALASTQALRSGALEPMPLPALVYSTPPPHLLPARAARPANRSVLVSKGQEQHN